MLILTLRESDNLDFHQSDPSSRFTITDRETGERIDIIVTRIERATCRIGISASDRFNILRGKLQDEIDHA